MLGVGHYKGEILLKRKEICFKAGFCFVNKNLEDLKKEMYILQPEETQYYKKVKCDKRRESYLLGRFAAKIAIRQILKQKIDYNTFSIGYGVFQFPIVKYIKDQRINVSISHCNSKGIALAFPEEHPMGIDIEKIEEDKVSSIKDLISNGEYKDINSCLLSKQEGTILIWTIKESLSKVLKTGLMVDFKILEIKYLQKRGEEYINEFKYFFQYKAVSRLIGGYMISIVLPKNTDCNLDDFWANLITHIYKNNKY